MGHNGSIFRRSVEFKPISMQQELLQLYHFCAADSSASPNGEYNYRNLPIGLPIVCTIEYIAFLSQHGYGYYRPAARSYALIKINGQSERTFRAYVDKISIKNLKQLAY